LCSGEYTSSIKLIRWNQDSGGVSAALHTQAGGEYSIRAAYMVAADGHASKNREDLGIGRSGRDHL
jgi:putative polyketide hydroxylase